MGRAMKYRQRPIKIRFDRSNTLLEIGMWFSASCADSAQKLLRHLSWPLCQ